VEAWDDGTRLGRWLLALEQRHQSPYTSAEFLKALRALSVRYVEQRPTLASRSPLDSAGKRAAFAAFYAPLHFLTVREIVRASDRRRSPLTRIVDLGCGTGVASAAWAMECASPPLLRGVDALGWAVDEAKWTWHELGLRGDARRGDLVSVAEHLHHPATRARLDDTGVVVGWSANELTRDARERLLTALLAVSARGASVLVIEPLARRAVPWWNGWVSAVAAAHGRVDEWRFDVVLPPRLARVDQGAGFRREGLSARSLWL
jgi:hypothetical protein